MSRRLLSHSTAKRRRRCLNGNKEKLKNSQSHLTNWKFSSSSLVHSFSSSHACVTLRWGDRRERARTIKMLILVQFNLRQVTSFLHLFYSYKLHIPKNVDTIFQVYFVFGMWRFICNARWSLRPKHLSHTIHLNGFAPVCFRWCLVSSSLRANLHSQSGHWQEYGFSPVHEKIVKKSRMIDDKFSISLLA